MSSFPRLALSVLVVQVPLVLGCGGPSSEQLTPEQIQKQHAENVEEMNWEDKAEAEFQKKKNK